MIHPVARGFERAAADYERGRPTFPPETIEFLRERLDLRPGRTVLDLAAGTGKLTRLLVPTGARVIAVEPLAAMRDALRETAPTVEALEGVAEAIPLDDGSVDAVTVAQAFHWFDLERAYRELHRVLRPEGVLALVWNVRDLDDPLQAAIDELLKPHRAAAAKTRDWELEFDTPARAGLFSDFELWTHRWVQQMDRDLLAARFRSVSFVATLPEAEQRVLLERIVAAADGLPVRFDFPYVTEVFISFRQT